MSHMYYQLPWLLIGLTTLSHLLLRVTCEPLCQPRLSKRDQMIVSITTLTVNQIS